MRKLIAGKIVFPTIPIVIVPLSLLNSSGKVLSRYLIQFTD